MKLFIAGLFLLLPGASLSAQFSQVASFSHIPPGPRSAALGGGVCALDDDPTAVFTNPAGLARIPHPVSASFDAGLLPYEQSLNFLGIAGWPVPELALGAGAILYGAGDDIEFRRANTGEPDSVESAFSQVYSVGIAVVLIGPIDAGLSLKFLADSIGDVTGKGFSADLGFLYHPYPPLTFGLLMQDAIGGSIDWSTDATEELPVLLHFGAAFELPPATFVAQIRDSSAGDRRFSLGLEYLLYGAAFLRAGIDDGRLAGGLGVEAKIRKRTGLRADYSLAQSAINPSELEHRIALTVFLLDPKWPMRKEVLPSTRYPY